MARNETGYLMPQAMRLLKWNAFGGIFFQGLLTLHHIFLSQIVDQYFFGFFGTIFSIIYASIILIDGGLKDSLGISFNKGSSSKKACKRLIIRPMIIQAALATLAIIFALLLITNEIVILKKYLAIDRALLILCSILVLTEWLTQIFKTLLQLNFQSKLVAIFESIFITVYLALVWVPYWYYRQLNIYSLIVPLFICSILGVLFLFFQIIKIYRQLPKESPEPFLIQKKMVKNRIYIYLHRLLHSLFSANFLIPFFAIKCGMRQAGVFKLAAQLSLFLLALFNHIFGFTSNTILAHLKQESLDSKRSFMKLFTEKINRAFFATIFFLLITTFYLVYSTSCVNSATLFDWSAVSLFLFITLSDMLLVAYEKLFIIEEKIVYLLITYFGSIIFMLIIFSLYSSFYYSIIFTLLATTRLLYTIAIRYLSSYLWSLRLQPKYFLNSKLLQNSNNFYNLVKRLKYKW